MKFAINDKETASIMTNKQNPALNRDIQEHSTWFSASDSERRGVTTIWAHYRTVKGQQGLNISESAYQRLRRTCRKTVRGTNILAWRFLGEAWALWNTLVYTLHDNWGQVSFFIMLLIKYVHFAWAWPSRALLRLCTRLWLGANDGLWRAVFALLKDTSWSQCYDVV